MALELLKSDYGNTEDEEVELSLSAAEEQGESLALIVYEKEIAQEGVQEAQMTNEWVGENVMPDELAFQRELEYQTKIENLLLQPYYDSVEPICIQAAPPYLELWEMNREPPSDDDSCSQGENLDLMVAGRGLPYDKVHAEMGIAQTINESVRENIMPVELAIQRELAYQKKIESLKLRSRYETEEPPLVVQGAPSKVELGETNKNSTFDNVSCAKGECLAMTVFEKDIAQEGVQEAQMTNEMVGGNIMPDELAFQRELEYQTKTENLQSQPCYYSEGAPKNLELWEMNRESPSDKDSCSQGDISDLMVFKSELTCEGARDEIAQMTNERLTRNIMPVELAIQRELAYQKKIESLKLHPRYDTEEPPIAVQGAPSNLELGEINRNPTSENVSCSQGEMSDLTFFERKLAPEKVQEEVISQMTNERGTRKIMSVELAIKRELEYQAKIKNLLCRPRNEFEEAPILIQGAPSDLELEKMNRKSHSDNISALQGRISDPMFIKRELEVKRSQGEITRREITGEKTRMNIMPVELAIQRELAFQRKFESSQSQPSITSQEPHIPFQGSSSNQRTVEVKRKAPSGNLTYLPRKVQQSYSMRIPETRFVNTFCKVCQLDCSSPFNLKQHYRGKIHRARVKLLETQKRNRDQVKGLVCYVCLITCTDEDSLQRHLAGKKHAACVEAKALKNSQR